MGVILEVLAGFAAGVLAGLTGVGGGVLLVPVLVAMGFPALPAIGTSNFAILISSTSGTVTNTLRFGLPWRRVLQIAVPAVILAPLGVWLAQQLPQQALFIAFAVFNLANIPLVGLRSGAAAKAAADSSATEAIPEKAATAAGSGTDSGAPPDVPNAFPKVVGTGAGAGVLAGLFGVGGGLVMVPMQVLLLSTPVRLASRISLAVVIFASISAVVTHGLSSDDVNWRVGVLLAVGGLLGAPLGASLLHRISDSAATRLFQVTMFAVAIYFIYKAFA